MQFCVCNVRRGTIDLPGSRRHRASLKEAGVGQQQQQQQPAPAAHGSTLRKCTRPAPSGGTCKNKATLQSGGLFCKGHTCPECGEVKGNAAAGCPKHATSASAGAGAGAGADAGEPPPLISSACAAAIKRDAAIKTHLHAAAELDTETLTYKERLTGVEGTDMDV
jgi:hypothetical protein